MSPAVEFLPQLAALPLLAHCIFPAAPSSRLHAAVSVPIFSNMPFLPSSAGVLSVWKQQLVPLPGITPMPGDSAEAASSAAAHHRSVGATGSERGSGRNPDSFKLHCNAGRASIDRYTDAMFLVKNNFEDP
jgi:hypothetical protein